MSTDDPQRTEEWSTPPEEGLEQREAAEARQFELRAELAETDARRAEEETAKAHEHVAEAEREEEKLSEKQRKFRERAAQAEGEAAEARRRAEEATGRGSSRPADPSLSGAHVTSPGLGSDTDPAAAASAAAGGSGARAAGGDDRLTAAQSALERPEVRAGVAFVGAFVVARILKRVFD